MDIKQLFPILKWLPNYNAKLFKGDLSAGLTVGIMLIPQGMAYAMLAGVPPIYGLYAAIFPQLVYALMGTSRQLGVGPVAMDSLLTAVAVSQFAQAESDEYVAIAILLALMVGVIQVAMGILRLGFLVNFLSRPVIGGFTSAAALIIGFSQLKHLLGVDIPGSQYFYEIVWFNLSEIGSTNVHSLWVGVLGILIILGFKKWLPSIPAPLVVVVMGILLVWGLGLHEYQVKIVEDIPSGLPVFGIPNLDWDMMQKLMGSAFTIAIVAFMEAIAVGKAIQARHKDYKIVPNQELLALGAGNIVGAMFQSFPTTGGFSRSAVNDQSGAKTNMAAIISALFVILTLMFLTSWFYFLPKAVLASIIMVAVFKLINIKEPKKLWGNDRQDFLVWLVTFVATLTIGIQLGILVGVLLSIMLMMYRIGYPDIEYKNGETRLYQKEYSELNGGQTIVLRFDEQLCYVNSELFQDKVEQLLEEKSDLKQLVLDASGINYIDSTAAYVLEEVSVLAQSKNIEMILLAAKDNIINILKKNNLEYVSVQGRSIENWLASASTV
ncbi:MAG: sulfate permease [Aureispira sp.]|nr:sulfate permease [Aureispira sp.]